MLLLIKLLSLGQQQFLLDAASLQKAPQSTYTEEDLIQ